MCVVLDKNPQVSTLVSPKDETCLESRFFLLGQVRQISFGMSAVTMLCRTNNLVRLV